MKKLNRWWAVVAASVGVAAGLGRVAVAADYWWGGSTVNWENGSFYTSQAGTTSFNFTPNIADTVVFAVTGNFNLATTINGDDATLLGIRTASNFASPASIGSTGGTVTVGSAGVSVASPTTFTISTPLKNSVSNYAMDVPNAAGTLALTGALTTVASGLTKTGPGLLVLGANNSFTSNVTISGGTLQIGNGGTTGAVLGNFINNGALVFNRSNDVVYSGSISGSGNLTKNGAGNLTLTNPSSYAGTTTINSGVIIGGVTNALSTLTALITNGGYYGPGGTGQVVTGLSGTGGGVGMSGTMTLTDNQAVDSVWGGAAYDGTLFGASTDTAKLVKQGAGRLTLTGNNSLGGGYTISGGTLQVGNGGTAGSIAGNVVNNAALVFNRSDASSYAGAISGTGSVTKLGTGLFSLLGTSTYQGATTITDGAIVTTLTNSLPVTTSLVTNGGLLIVSGGIPATSQTVAALSGTGGGVQVNTNRSFIVNQSSNTTFAGSVYDGNFFGSSTDVGNFTKQGAGTLTMTGANVIGGTYTISGGTLEIGNGGTTGSIGGNVVNNSSLKFNRSDNLTYTGVISGSGAVLKAGAGTLTLTGTSNPLGLTTVSAGALQLGNGGAAGLVTGNILNNSSVVFNRSDTVTYAGVVSGAGTLVQQGSGLLVIAGAQIYTGPTVISAGSLQIGNGGTLGSVAGNIVDNATVIFSRSNDTTYAGSISGMGSLMLNNSAGTYTFLSGSNSYAGNTNLISGFLYINGLSALPGTTNVNMTSNAGLLIDLPGTATQTIRSLSGAGQLLIGGDTLVVNQTADTVYSGSIFDQGSVAALTKQGAGKLTLSGAVTLGGVTTISGGTLQIGNGGTSGSISGNIADNASLVFNRSDDTNYAGLISGSGSLTKDGTGVLSLGSTHTYGGATLISKGVLQLNVSGALPSTTDVTIASGAQLTVNSGVSQTIKSLSGAGHVALGQSTLAVNQNSDTVFGGGIGEFSAPNAPGVLIKLGTGTLTSTGDLLHTGGTTISGGKLQIGNGGTTGTIAGNVLDNATLTFNRADNLTYSGTISGTGGLEKTGAGTLTLTGSTTIGGPTLVFGGALQIGNGGTTGSIAGSIENNGTVVFNRSDTVTYLGVLAGTATSTVIKTGPGTLIFTQNNSDLPPGYQTFGNLIVSEGTFQYGDGVTNGGLNGYAGAQTVIDNGDVTYNLPLGAGINSPKTGTGTMTIIGGGTIDVLGPLDYTGGTRIKAGRLTLAGGGRLPIGGDVTISGTGVFGPNNGQWDLAGQHPVIGNLILNSAAADNVYGTTVAVGAVVDSTTDSLGLARGGSLTVNGNVTSSGANPGFYPGINFPVGIHRITTPDAFPINGSIGGAGSVTFGGTGSIYLLGFSTYSGTTTVGDPLVGDQVTVTAFGSSLPATTRLTIGDDSTLTLQGDETVTSLAGGELSTLNFVPDGFGGGPRLTVNGPHTTTFSGTINEQGISPMEPSYGPGELVKAGTGTLTLTGPRNKVDTIEVAGGTLNIVPTQVFSPSANVTGLVIVDGGGLMRVSGTSLKGVAVALVGDATAKANLVVSANTDQSVMAYNHSFNSLITSLSITNDGAALGSRDYYGRFFLDQYTIFRNASYADLFDMARAYVASSGVQGIGGILTSENGPFGPVPFTRLGIIPNTSSKAGVPFYSTFPNIDEVDGGVRVFSFDSLARVTYLGDTNLDGILNAADLANVIEGLSTGKTGWQWGDLDYSGVVTVSDLTTFLAVYNMNLPSLGFGDGAGGSSGTVPEPTGLAISAGTLAVLSRRRR